MGAVLTAAAGMQFLLQAPRVVEPGTFLAWHLALSVRQRSGLPANRSLVGEQSSPWRDCPVRLHRPPV
ncbi:MAG: hypothetical protein NVS2B7_02010 [Herpetosiphon sp.]